ncbi:MAG: hypothetical protein GC191_02670 [Azospirillum sp.]|nr:hypothetical protein [Azospirillum sp.]
MRVIDAVSVAAGSKANEDILGHCGDDHTGAAWVLDGATGLAPSPFIPDTPSDAFWLANRLGAALSELSLAGSFPPEPPLLFRRVLDRVLADFQANCPELAIPAGHLPAAAGAWVRWQPNRGLEFAALGDCRGLLKARGATATALGHSTADSSDAKVNAAVRAFHQAGITDPVQIWDRIKDGLRHARTKMNHPGGLWALGLVPAAADHLDLDHRAVAGPATLLLLSDGLYRLVDTYFRYDPEGLVNAAAERGLAELCRELRQIEAADPSCQRYPRLKPTDDASALLLAC